MLAFAVLASAVVATGLGYAVFLLAWGYAHADPMAIPYFYFVVIGAGTPATLVCGVAWTGYIAVARRDTPVSRGPCRSAESAPAPR